MFFPVTKRSGPSSKLIRCRRFNSVKFGWKNSPPEDEERIDFKVDRDILFHGANMFGSKDNTYSASLRLLVDTGLHFSYVPGGSTAGTFPSVVDTSGTFYCFDVLLKNPVPLKKDVTYWLVANVSGPDSWYGTQGRHTYLCSGVKFTLGEFLDTTQGQFNELIFSHCK